MDHVMSTRGVRTNSRTMMVKMRQMGESIEQLVTKGTVDRLVLAELVRTMEISMDCNHTATRTTNRFAHERSNTGVESIPSMIEDIMSTINPAVNSAVKLRSNEVTCAFMSMMAALCDVIGMADRSGERQIVLITGIMSMTHAGTIKITRTWTRAGPLPS